MGLFTIPNAVELAERAVKALERIAVALEAMSRKKEDTPRE
jgi:hypothetical protein